MNYSITTDYMETVTGTSNTCSRVYMEAEKNIKEDNNKSLNYLKNFLTSIEFLSKKKSVKDERITKSGGNIKNITGYDNITFMLDFLKKPLGSHGLLKDLQSIHDKLVEYSTEYVEGYNKKNGLIIVEYESAAYILITGLVMIMANNIDFTQDSNGIKIQKKNEASLNVLSKVIKDLAKQLSNKNHQKYLSELNKLNEPGNEDGVFKEAIADPQLVSRATASVINGVSKMLGVLKYAWKGLKNTMFGIIPIIRAIYYIKYKNKIDYIEELEELVIFLEQNIKRLENDTSNKFTPEKKVKIIKKQQAAITRYQKKIERMKAEFIKTERNTSEIMKSDNATMSQANQSAKNDDFVLENGLTFYDILKESYDDDEDDYIEALDEEDDE